MEITREGLRSTLLEAINQALSKGLNPVEIYGELQILKLHIQVQCEMNIQQMIILSNQARAAQEQPTEETKED